MTNLRMGKAQREGKISENQNGFRFLYNTICQKKNRGMCSKFQRSFLQTNPVYETAKETLMYRSVLWTLWERERVGKFGENGIETCIISCMKRVASPGSMHNTGCLGLVHWDDPEGWYGEGGGFRMGNTCIPVADPFRYLAKLIQYCKV